jgi:DNA helicase-2/ATP-dependent DNA helicase PcrA
MIGYIEGPLGSGKTGRLLANTVELLQRVPASSVLVLCSNHTRKARFVERLLQQQQAPLAQMPVYTYAGFVRNTLFNYWPLVEGMLRQGSAIIQPELSGLEDSELMLRWLLSRLRREWQEKGETPYQDFPGNDKHILKQLVRRLRQRSENQLTREAMAERSALLEEPCQRETRFLEENFDRISYRLRTLDSNKQLDVFHNLLKRENALSGDLRGNIKHLLVDDVDETIHAQQQFIQWLAPSLDSLVLAADVDGGSRRGYLNAYPYDWQALKALRPGPTELLTRDDVFYQAGQTLLANWKRQEDFEPLPPQVRFAEVTMTRLEMMTQVVDDLVSLLETGAQPGDFCLVLPKTDFLSLHQLTTRLRRLGLPYQLLSGTKRPSDNPKCRAFLTFLHWANTRAWGYAPSPLELKQCLLQGLHASQWPGMTEESLDALSQCLYEQAITVLQAPVDSLLPIPPLIPISVLEEGNSLGLGDEGRAVMQRLAIWLQKAQALSFDRQLYSAFQDLIAVYSNEKSAYPDLNRIIDSYLKQKAIFDGLAAGDPTMDFNRWWFSQIKSGAVADAPDVPKTVDPEAIVVATAQKVIDAEVSRKKQFWLDVSCREWARSDNAPLYNAWVHSAVWDGSNTAFSEEFNEAVIRTRAGHITRTLMLLATEEVRTYASELDDLGAAQESLLVPRLQTTSQDTSGIVERAILRPDQAPILEYRSGTMAISAVPGAGKTFVNVELLLELIGQGIEPDSILVLTYMDAAAKTLLSRLKKKLAGVTQKLPVVSTIHSLALKILTENDQALLLHQLPEEMTILDDFGRGEILLQVATATMPESARNGADWQRAIDRGVNHVKMLNLSPGDIARHSDKTFRLLEFLPAYEAYQQALHDSGSLDFTDLIQNVVGILRDYPDIRAKYQQRFRFIIEDEAQDSSRVLQEFIQLLGGKSPNLIRTGDTNQSITTTFSSAEPAVFRDFIAQADRRVLMDRSGRCAPEVMALANQWMAAAEPGLEQAFQQVAMQAVEGQNPALWEPISATLFDNELAEESWLTAKILAFKAEQPEASIAVLVRHNGKVNHVTGFLQQAGIKAVSLSETLNANPVFKRILATLKLLAQPADLNLQSEWGERMREAALLPEDSRQEGRLAFLAEKPLLYALPEALNDEWLRQWHYDLIDFSRQTGSGNLGGLVARLADRLCPVAEDRSNGYLCALMAAEILQENRQEMGDWEDSAFQQQAELSHSALEIVIARFEAFQRSWRGRKGFGDLLGRHGGDVVQVMTLHKAKGQEFDAVFMPFLQAKAFPHDMKTIRFEEADKLIRDLDRLTMATPAGMSNADANTHYSDAKKREKIEEEARLIYVGLTRARRALHLSAHKQSFQYQRLQATDPAMAFKRLASYLAPPLNDAAEAENQVS